jgi:hypothetical protein
MSQLSSFRLSLLPLPASSSLKAWPKKLMCHPSCRCIALFSTCTYTTPSANADGMVSQTITVDPFSTALSMNWCPSVADPLIATKMLPRFTALESDSISVTSTSVLPARDLTATLYNTSLSTNRCLFKQLNS